MANRYYIGTSGWVYPHWRGRFYPDDLPQKRWLQYYAQHFDTVEINNTFYRLPSSDAVAQWRRDAPERFVFAVKMSRFLTHVKRLHDPEEPVERFMEVVFVLREHLGPVLVQMPESFHRNDVNMERLHKFFQILPPKPPFVMEFRHASWFREGVYALMEDYQVSLCIVSDPKRPTDFRVTGKIVYVRFHGPKQKRYRGNYPESELREWARRMETLADGRKSYIYFNNDWNAYAVKNALRLKELLDAKTA